MKKFFVFAVFVVLLFAGIFYIADQKHAKAPVAADKKVQVVATFYPLAEFARNVAGNHADIVTLVPVGFEPHDYEPRPNDIAAISNSNIFLTNGPGLDSWAEKASQDAKGVVLTMSNYIEVAPPAKSDLDLADESQQSGAIDPHFWLDPIFAQKEVQVIRDAFIQVDPRHAAEYRTNAKDYIDALQKLNDDFVDGLSQCKMQTTIVSHDAYNYLSRRYDLKFLAIAGLSPDAEPSPQHLAQVVDFAKKNHIQYFFFESLVNPKLTNTLAQEAGAKTLVLNPIEGLSEDEQKAGRNYLSIMRENLHNLQIANGCQ